MKNQKNSEAAFLSHMPLLWTLFVVLLVLIDQLTKYLAVRFLAGKEAITLIPGVLELTYLENRGMAFGMFQGKQFIFAFFCILFLAVLVYLFIMIPKNKYYFPLILTGGLLAAGAVGNLIDRVLQNYVVDFIYVSLIDFPVFNAADIYVVCGGILLVVLVMFRYTDEDFLFLKPKKFR